MAAPQKSIWKLIPRTGTMRVLVDFLNTNIVACSSHEVITRSQLLHLESLYKYLLPYQKHLFRSDITIQFRRFKRMDYKAFFKVIIPNTKQLDRDVYGKSRIGNRRTPENIAKHELSKVVMLDHLDTSYPQERIPYLSDWDLMYGYCHGHSYKTPRIFAHKTQKDDSNPHRATAVAHTQLIRDAGTVILYGDVCDTYGTALVSTCGLLKNMVDGLKLSLPEDKCSTERLQQVHKQSKSTTCKLPVEECYKQSGEYI